ncbi:Thymidylate kinase [Candidatus Erwinia haradaeae]|uniref:Thymidylate kinase n=1 Tax=Candidatus Erwinia haradaeae TaxID=1922217 RepID=A0A451DKB3_9GAMM|nr:dTMP kinase [Candidatus Erwinia haradaeae]VFP87154.1 Thymidylate kinase [Candidatus Erwinia haradaeae]
MNSKFIVIEGLEGAGKTTSSLVVANILREHGIHDVIYTREPGSTPLSEKLRELIKNDTYNEEKITYYAELFVVFAARVQLVEHVIKPALARGTWVIGDRHELSSRAYQGGGREISHDFICSLKEEALGNFNPDLTLYLDVPPEISLQRVKKRGPLDRIEKESLHFFTKIRNQYLALAASDKQIRTIDASRSQAQVALDIENIIHQWLQEIP